MRTPSRRQVLRGIGIGTTATMASMAGCSGNGGGGDGTDGGGAADGGSTGTPGRTLELTIACPTALSGPFAPDGIAERDAGMLAATHLEEDLDVKVDIVTGDTETDPSTAVDRLERMVVEDGAVAGYGGVASSVGLALGSWGNENQVPFLTHGTSSAITGADCNPFMFSSYLSNSMMVRPVAGPMADMEDRWAIIYSDYTWGQTANESFIEHLEANGASVVHSEPAPFPNQDYTSQLNAVANTDATGLLVAVAGLDQRTALQQLYDLGLHEQFSTAFHQNEDVLVWGLDQEIVSNTDIASVVWSPAVDFAEEFKQQINESSEQDPFVRHAISYMSVDQIVRAVVRADSTNGDDIRAELEGHQVNSDRVLAIQGNPDTMYWREEDHQLIQPAYATRALPPSDMQNDPYKVWFEIINSMTGEEVSPSPSDDCNMDG